MEDGNVEEFDPHQPFKNVEVPEDTWEEGMDDGAPVDVGCVETENGSLLVGLPPAYNYACRGAQLEHLCALEYMCLVSVDKVHADTQMTDSHRGRPKNVTFPFHPKHAMFEQYVQRLHSQLRCPLLSGKKLPPWPGENGGKRAQAQWAQYIMTLLVPWSIDVTPKLMWADLKQMEHSYSMPSSTYLERSRHAFFMRLRHFSVVDKKASILSTLVHQRNRKNLGCATPARCGF